MKLQKAWTMKTVLALATALALAGGCGRDPSKEVEALPSAAPTSAPAAASAKATGIPECDEYFKQAAICFAKDPAMKAQREESIEPLRAALKARAAAPEQRERTREQCRQHTEQLMKDCGL